MFVHVFQTDFETNFSQSSPLSSPSQGVAFLRIYSVNAVNPFFLQVHALTGPEFNEPTPHMTAELLRIISYRNNTAACYLVLYRFFVASVRIPEQYTNVYSKLLFSYFTVCIKPFSYLTLLSQSHQSELY